MPQSNDEPRAQVLVFADCELDVERFELRRSGLPVSVQPLVLELIVYLARQRDRVVTRDELGSAIWKSRVVSDAAIARALRKARAALGDSGDEQGRIATVHGRGFRFVATLTTRERSAAPAASATSAARFDVEPWVGRSDSTSTLEGLLARAARGRGATWLVVGEAGIGKSRLLERSIELARAQGCAAYLGRCLDLPGAPACLPWVQIAQGALAELPAQSAAALRVGLAPLLDEHGLDLDDPQARFRLFEAMLGLLRVASRARPVVLALDDLQHADATSLALAEWVSREARTLPLLLVCASRQGHEGPSRALGAMLHGASELLELGGLSRAELAELLTILTGARPSSALIDEVHDRTGGNPLYVQHLWPLIHARSGAARRALPATLREAILSRVREIAGDDHEVLGAAAAVGDDFTPAEVAAGADLPMERVALELEQACLQNLVRRLPHPAGTLCFSHGVVREALYEQLSPERRASIHGRLAGLWLEAKARAPSARTGRLAYHALRGPFALRTGDGIRFGLAAIEDAFVRGAFDQSAAVCEATLSAMALCPAPHPERENVTLRLASALGRAGRMDEAATAFRVAAQDRFGEQTRIALRDVDVATLHDSLEQIGAKLPQVVHVMYERLFEKYPVTRSLFRRNPSEVQERMLVDTLTSVLDHFEDAPWLTERLLALGARHVDYNVTEAMYGWVGESLLGALEQVCGDAWSPELERAWKGAYAAISGIMRQGARVAARPALAGSRAPRPRA